MGDGEAKPQPTLGFLTIVEHEQHGLFGGFLILNLAGRPIEFHCTAPIKPNRAQEILFGPTLEAYLYGEQIGQTLIAKGGPQPLAVCTDRAAALCVREYVATPVALVHPPDDAAETRSAGADLRFDPPHRGGPSLAPFTLGRNRLAVSPRHDRDRDEISKRLESLAESFDLWEPFGRIREAIAEAQRTAR